MVSSSSFFLFFTHSLVSFHSVGPNEISNIILNSISSTRCKRSRVSVQCKINWHITSFFTADHIQTQWWTVVNRQKPFLCRTSWNFYYLFRLKFENKAENSVELTVFVGFCNKELKFRFFNFVSFFLMINRSSWV